MLGITHFDLRIEFTTGMVRIIPVTFTVKFWDHVSVREQESAMHDKAREFCSYAEIPVSKIKRLTWSRC